jgi:beta-lactamase regulating signal transducer with metallopeptidase domain
MTFWFLTAAVTFGIFAAMVTIGSVVVRLAAPAIARRLEGYSPAARAAGLFRLRMMPAALAAAIAFGIVLPTFLAYEPRETEEAIPATASLLACIGAGLLLGGVWRAISAWRATRRVVREWQRRGRRLEHFDTPLPVFAIEERFPTVAVVGVARPALFIAERVLRECPEDEVRAMLHHECAHVTKRDNLKRFFMRACPDFVGVDLDRAWARAAEEAADAAVVAGDPQYAVELAQALIHVARLAPAPQAPALASAFYLGGSIESRVRRLIQPEPERDVQRKAGRAIAIGSAVAAVGAVLATAPAVHRAIETIIHSLP